MSACLISRRAHARLDVAWRPVWSSRSVRRTICGTRFDGDPPATATDTTCAPELVGRGGPSGTWLIDTCGLSAVRKRQKSILPPPTITKVWFSSYNYKTGYFTPSTFQTVHFTSLERFWRLFATVTVVLSFTFLKKFQLNLWKIIVNHKKIIK